ncbi:glycosyltransferase family 4 protein [soil metagenome]
MRIVFYAPLKEPDHPVPSGDREMARLLIRALVLGGHEVEVASRLRSFMAEPALAAAELMAAAERARLTQAWRAGNPPDLWLCYHPYYKAPDFIGPSLARDFGIPYVTAESSYAPKRDMGPWREAQAHVADGLRLARLNICFTERDRAGLAPLSPHTALLNPFIDTEPYAAITPSGEPGQMIAVAMMRKGDKLESYTMLAAALRRIGDLSWSLSVIGDGPMREPVAALFEGLPVRFLGERPPAAIPDLLSRASLYVWPGCGEAYGLAYLEAQAAGLPVIAQATGGISAVVTAGETGLLTPEGDIDAYVSALRRMLTDNGTLRAMGRRARDFVLRERSLPGAAERLNALLAEAAP